MHNVKKWGAIHGKRGAGVRNHGKHRLRKRKKAHLPTCRIVCLIQAYKIAQTDKKEKPKAARSNPIAKMDPGDVISGEVYFAQRFPIEGIPNAGYGIRVPAQRRHKDANPLWVD